MADLAELLVLMHGARHRFRTVRAEVVERRHDERLHRAMERWMARRPGTASAMLVASLPGVSPPEWSESVTHLRWAKPDRLRLQRDDWTKVVVGDNWWSVSELLGSVAGGPSSDVQIGIENPPFPALLDPAVLLPDLDLEVMGEARLFDRAVLSAHGRPRGQREEWAESHVVRGADDVQLWVDRERGVVLRLETRIGGEPFQVTEVREIAFDEEFPEQTWVLEPPAGESFGPLALPRQEQVSVDEAQRRAPFTVLLPGRAPAGAELEITFGPATDRPPAPAFVTLSYRVPDRGLDVSISQTRAETDHAIDVMQGAERVERDGRTVTIRDMGGQLQAVAEHLGTRAMLLSQSAPRDLVVEMALSLDPAPADPPALTG